MKERDQYFSRAVEKALAALECVRKSPQPMTLAEISAAVKLTKASVFRAGGVASSGNGEAGRGASGALKHGVLRNGQPGGPLRESH